MTDPEGVQYSGGRERLHEAAGWRAVWKDKADAHAGAVVPKEVL